MKGPATGHRAASLLAAKATPGGSTAIERSNVDVRRVIAGEDEGPGAGQLRALGGDGAPRDAECETGEAPLQACGLQHAAAGLPSGQSNSSSGMRVKPR